MISPARPVRRSKKRSSNRLAGTATTSAAENAATITSSASCPPAIVAPSAAQTSTGTPLRPITRSVTVQPPGELVDDVQDVGRRGSAPQHDDLEPAARVV